MHYKSHQYKGNRINPLSVTISLVIALLWLASGQSHQDNTYTAQQPIVKASSTIEKITHYFPKSHNTIIAIAHAESNMNPQAQNWSVWQMERTLDLAEAVGRQILTVVTLKEDGTENPALLSIKQRESEYTRDALTIARKTWNKKDGINIIVQLPQPIIDLGLVESDLVPEKSLVE